MAFFKFRKSGTEQSGPGAAPESLEVLHKRARHRLIGAAALVLLGVVGFPLLFDSQPRPIAVDIPINIPDKAKAVPLTAAPASASTAVPDSSSQKASAITPDAPAPSVTAVPPAPAKTQANTETKTQVGSQAKAESKPDAKLEVKAEAKPDPKAEVKSPIKIDDKALQANKAQALLDGKEPAKAAAVPRYTVQVGAFADAQKAREARTTLEKAGIRTYTQVVVTADGNRTRVRVGPWEDRAEAEKTAEKIKKLNLAASVLTL